MWQTQAKGGEGRGGGSATGKREKDPVFLFPHSPLPFSPTLLTPAMQANNIVHILLIASLSSSVPTLLLYFGFAFDFNLATQNTGASMQNFSFWSAKDCYSIFLSLERYKMTILCVASKITYWDDAVLPPLQGYYFLYWKGVSKVLNSDNDI